MLSKIYILVDDLQNVGHFDISKNAKITGGVHLSIIHQVKTFQNLGCEVRVCIIRGNATNEIFDNFQVEKNIDGKLIEDKNFYHTFKHTLPNFIRHKLQKFKPDLFITQQYRNWIMRPLYDLGIPTLTMVHSLPLYLWDLRRSKEYEYHKSLGNKIGIVSNYAKKYYVNFYDKKSAKYPKVVKSTPDYVLYPSYCEKYKVENCIKKVSHISRADRSKDTFLIHDYLEGTEFKSNVHTQSYSNPFNEVNDRYLQKNLLKYRDTTKLDFKHKDIMEDIKDSAATFVGLANYDTFTITSLESLSRGIPLLIKSRNNLPHPATEMVENDYKKYIYEFTDRDDFIQKVKEFSKMSLDERQKLADSCYKKMGWENFKKTWNNAALETIESFKYKNSVLEEFV